MLNAQLTKKLNVNKIIKAAENCGKADRTAFQKMIDLSRMVTEAVEYWNTEGKAIAKAEGITMNMDEFASLYGWQKSYLYKLDRCGKQSDEVVEKFLTACDEMEQKGSRPSISIESFMKYVKSVENGGEVSGEGGEETEGGQEGGGEVSTKPIVTFTCRLADLGLADKNVSVRVDADGNVTTTSEADAIKKAIEVLTKALKAKK